jgi:FAD synthase
MDITVLFPGSFKPMHAGHINLINQCLEKLNINEIQIYVAKTPRDNISQYKALEIINLLITNNKLTVKLVQGPSPVTAIYKFLENVDHGTYSLLSSNKFGDDERLQKFYKYMLKVKNVDTIILPIDINPMLYKNRLDDNNEKPISSSILRQDVLNNDFENFKTNYPNHAYNIINQIWKLLKDK